MFFSANDIIDTIVPEHNQHYEMVEKGVGIFKKK